MRHLTLLPHSTMTSPSTGQSTLSAANPPVDTVPVDGALVASSDTVTVTDNITVMSPLPSHLPIQAPPVYPVM